MKNNEKLTKKEIFAAFQPKQKHRYIVYLNGFPPYIIKTIDRPSGKYDAKLDKITWNSITLELYDPVVPSTAQTVLEWIEEGNARDMTIKLLSVAGDTIEKWFIKGCRLKEFDFGKLRWDSEEVVTIKLTLDIESAKLLKKFSVKTDT